MDLTRLNEDQLREALAVAAAALERIYAGDPGPAHSVAAAALRQIQEVADRV